MMWADSAPLHGGQLHCGDLQQRQQGHYGQITASTGLLLADVAELNVSLSCFLSALRALGLCNANPCIAVILGIGLYS